MTFAALLQAMSGSALDTLAGFDEQAALDAGLDPNTVRSWAGLHAVYLAETHAHQQQARARGLVRRSRLSLHQLALVERKLSSVPARERGRKRLDVLEAVAASRPGDYQAFARMVAKLVPAEPKELEPTMTVGPSVRGMCKIMIFAEEKEAADLTFRCSQGLDASRPAGPQMYKNFKQVIRSGGVARAVPHPLLLVPAPALSTLVAGECDANEVRFGLTNGTTITGAEFLSEYFSDAGVGLEAAIFHPVEGPVNLYRVERFANQKQRDLARATTPVCPVPGCHRAADLCQVHHIQAWKHGGPTNMRNLTMLCRYHNRVNDDDDWVRRRGRIEVVDGDPTWVSPRGYPVANPYHPFGAMRTLFGK